jgi:hypothetical protein
MVLVEPNLKGRVLRISAAITRKPINSLIKRRPLRLGCEPHSSKMSMSVVVPKSVGYNRSVRIGKIVKPVVPPTIWQ